MADYLSINEFPGNGSIMQIEVSFAGNNPDVGSGAVPYFKSGDVKAQFFTPATPTTPQIVEDKPLTYVGPNTFITQEIVPVGKVLRVYRETEDRFSLVNFVALQNVTERDLDALARQTVFLVEEAKDAAQFAINTAREAIKYSTSATSVAEQASTLALSADKNSTLAVTAANQANATANSAKQIAIAAADDAAAAEEHASNVETLAADAQVKAGNALAAASRAESKGDQAINTANAIDGKAQSAIKTANQATSTANSAKSVAEAIEGKANQAAATANSAANTAADAKATAEKIDTKATAALSTANSATELAGSATVAANQAKAAADQANANVSGKVNKTGDRMTGELTNTSGYTAEGTSGYNSGPHFQMHWPGHSAGMIYLNNNGQITFAQTGGQGSASLDIMHISIGDGELLHKYAATFKGVLTASGGVYANTLTPATGGMVTVSGKLRATGDIEAAGGVFRCMAPDGANAHLYFTTANGTERALLYADTSNNLNIRTSASGTSVIIRNSDKGMTVTGGIDSASLSATGRVSAGEVLAVRDVWSGNGASWLASDGNIYGGVWGGYLSNYLSANYMPRSEVGGVVMSNVAAQGVGAVGTYAMLQTRGNLSVGPGTMVNGSQLGWACSGGDFNEIVGYGSWRLMGRVNTGSKVVSTSIWLRVS